MPKQTTEYTRTIILVPHSKEIKKDMKALRKTMSTNRL